MDELVSNDVITDDLKGNALEVVAPNKSKESKAVMEAWVESIMNMAAEVKQIMNRVLLDADREHIEQALTPAFEFLRGKGWANIRQHYCELAVVQSAWRKKKGMEKREKLVQQARDCANALSVKLEPKYEMILTSAGD